MSSIAKFDVKKFDGSNDFGLWRVKMLCLLIQHGWEAALDPFPEIMENAEKTAALKTDVYKKVHSALLSCLDNKVLREVNKEDSAAGVWLKLETLYMTKSLANKLYLKKKLFTFYIDSGKKLSEHIDEFNKLIGDLANIGVDIDDEDQALMLLTSLPSSYDNFVETLLYGRESLTLEDVLSDHRDCPKRNKKKSTGFVKKNAGQGSGMHSEGYDNGDLLMAVSDERFLEWIMDSGGSFHMTPRRDFLFDFKEFNGGTVLIGNNRACAIMRIGKGYTVKLQNERVKVIKGSLMVLSKTMKGHCVYPLDGWAESGKASVGIQEKESLAQVWHKRRGHISEAGLHELEKKEVLGNKGLGKLEFCENCVLEKSTRGPSRVESMSGCRYFLSIVDDYSRRVWVHFLRHKNESFSKFNEWKQLVENQTESGIARHLTVAGTPQQNGLAERMNMTLLNKVRCLPIQSGLPDSFWAEATATATYLINMSPSTTLEKKTPMDLWSGHPANYEMLRIFGCVAYSHVNQGKLKLRAIKYIFLGYPDGVKGYRLWRLDDVKPKIIISRDVVFNESLMYKDTLKGAGAADSGKEVEFEVELQGSRVIRSGYQQKDRKPSQNDKTEHGMEKTVQNQGQTNHRVEPTVDPHTRENIGNEDEEQDEGPQQQNLDNYVLVLDRAKRTTTIPADCRCSRTKTCT
ncbi:retrovirus-related pol polyprotein from transposon TNT 1-94 [Tanacetum coccineum]|uniref:Retrovirus-related pol polyprotein from transposon TNT 1-94 n=1 Tax=Tanacetum coccineum TaxID=301880 RepID=A0ABQ5D9T5_9ASTR